MNISIKNLSFTYKNTAAQGVLFNSFSLELNGTFPAALLGASGCGKTTLLKLIGGLLQPCGGSVSVQSRGGPCRIAMIFQEPRLLPWRSALENVSIPLKKEFGAGALERAALFLEQLGLGKKKDAYPGELSGGEKQRVAIARAFAYPASLVLMDEPFQSLDIPLRMELMELSAALLEKERRSCILVSHDPREALFLARRVIVLAPTAQGTVTVYDKTMEQGKNAAGTGLEETLKKEQELLAVLKPL